MPLQQVTFYRFVLDAAAPTLSSTSPADNATGVAVTANLTATFSEAIAFHTAVSILLKRTSDNSTVETFDETDIGGTISISGSTLTINPTANLTNNVGYYVTIGATSIKDLAGNFYAGLSSTTAWSFTTVSNDSVMSFSGLTTPQRRWAAAAHAGLSDGTAISSFTGQVGGIHATQGTGGNQPTKQTVSGKTVIRFDGTNDFLTFTQLGELETLTASVLLKASGANVILGCFAEVEDPEFDTSQVMGYTPGGGSANTFYIADNGNNQELARSNTAAVSSALTLLTLQVVTPTTVNFTDSGGNLLEATFPHGFSVGDRLRFTTTNTLPGGLATETDYFVLATDLTATEFRVSATAGGSQVTISDGGTGTHTADAGNVRFFKNGVAAGSGTILGDSAGRTMTVGAIGALRSPHEGSSVSGFGAMDVAEVILWNTAIADRAAVDAALVAHYGI